MAIIFGTPGDDTLIGGSKGEELYGVGGVDLIHGMNGVETVMMFSMEAFYKFIMIFIQVMLWRMEQVL